MIEADQTLKAKRAEINSPAQNLLADVLEYVTPLNLVDPRSPGFRLKGSRPSTTLSACPTKKPSTPCSRSTTPGSCPAAWSTPGVGRAPGYLHHRHRPRTERRPSEFQSPSEDITSTPMKALFRGMTTEASGGPAYPHRFQGIVSVFANTMFDASKHERRLGDRSYAIVSRNYVNFSSRLGYHFSIVDAYISAVENDNYISSGSRAERPAWKRGRDGSGSSKTC